ncbi:ABC transporter ATP-binding protein [Candidatus Dojkabacteria bacterium]|nr:ABC transporter ATP-binding protein [Candidatus Dojkabacteria bacterium]
MNKQKPIITVKNLSKKYNGLQAVNSVTFEVFENEIFGILGPNGAGKTTTIEMIEGIREIDIGDIEIDGIDVDKNPDKAKELLGIQLQDSEYFDHLNLCEILDLFGQFYSRKVDPKDILDKVELSSKGKSLVKQLSGGQKQRLSIALSLVNDPKILFLDEPTTGLDPQARRHMWDLIERLRKEHRTIILTTHYMEEAEILCDRVAVMDEGKILTIDTPDNLINELLKKGFKKEIKIKEANLEDVFLDLTGKKLRD